MTTERDTSFYPVASLETASLATERNYYAGVDTGRVNKSTVSGYPSDTYTSPNDFIQKLNGAGPKTGTNMVLKVMTGDKVNLFAKSWYKKNGVTPGTPVNPLTSILNVLEPAIGGITASHGGATLTELQTTSVLDNQVTSFLNSQSGYTTSKPKAFVNWVLFDEQFSYVAASSGFEQVGADNTLTTHTPAAINISKGGYLYIYVSNETPNIDVFFDNLQVTHIRGPILEETHYYPFGLTMAGISGKALAFGEPENKKKYQNYEFNSDFDLNLYESFYRTHDPQLGRFWQLDPKPTDFESLYAAMGNNPIRNIDILGDSIGPNRTVPVNVYVVSLTKDKTLKLDYERLLKSAGEGRTYILNADALNGDAADKIKSHLGDDGYVNTMVVDYHRSDYDKMDGKGKDDFYTSLSKGYTGDKTSVLLGMCWAGGLELSANDKQNLPDLTAGISKQLDKATVYGLKTEANSIGFNLSGNFGVLNPAYYGGNNKWARHERAYESEWTVSSYNASAGKYVTNDIYKTVSLTTKGVISVTAPTTITTTDIPFK